MRELTIVRISLNLSPQERQVLCVVSLSKTATFSARNKSMIAPQKWLPGMIRQVPGKTNEIIGPEITFGRSVAFRHRGWARQGLPDSRTRRGFRSAASDGKSHAGIKCRNAGRPSHFSRALSETIVCPY
ncbi:hypothetical protein [Bradyrhizobium sp. 170]|uniref:hypothetical protein n=1 Tax=Bradyrhizobium sp. 170 TaxID=2782641 RepID=UPI001FFF9730|nr:hypothetical protein [Bradyrhizobium sp. 170]UPK05339.1 hypothetical protein IVB05_06430 [Bradyrhizobium sp. 170]